MYTLEYDLLLAFSGRLLDSHVLFVFLDMFRNICRLTFAGFVGNDQERAGVSENRQTPKMAPKVGSHCGPKSGLQKLKAHSGPSTFEGQIWGHNVTPVLGPHLFRRTNVACSAVFMQMLRHPTSISSCVYSCE